MFKQREGRGVCVSTSFLVVLCGNVPVRLLEPALLCAIVTGDMTERGPSVLGPSVMTRSKKG